MGPTGGAVDVNKLSRSKRHLLMFTAITVSKQVTGNIPADGPHRLHRFRLIRHIGQRFACFGMRQVRGGQECRSVWSNSEVLCSSKSKYTSDQTRASGVFEIQKSGDEYFTRNMRRQCCDAVTRPIWKRLTSFRPHDLAMAAYRFREFLLPLTESWDLEPGTLWDRH